MGIFLAELYYGDGFLNDVYNLNSNKKSDALNLKLFDVVSMETAAPGDPSAYQWGPVSVAAAFGGSMPKQFMLMFDNQTAGTTTAITINTYGIQYTST